MSIPHLHLMLTHFPIAGLVLSFLLILYALWRKNDQALSFALAGVFISGLMVLPLLWTGEGAEDIVEHLPGVRESTIDAHEDSATGAAVLAVIAAGLALGTLVARQHWPRFVRWGQTSVVITGLLAIVAIGWTSNLGGQIRHPEIAAGFVMSPSGAGQQDEGFSLFSRARGDTDDDDDDDDDERGEKDDD